jgi:hypothetical protein
MECLLTCATSNANRRLYIPFYKSEKENRLTASTSAMCRVLAQVPVQRPLRVILCDGVLMRQQPRFSQLPALDQRPSSENLASSATSMAPGHLHNQRSCALNLARVGTEGAMPRDSESRREIENFAEVATVGNRLENTSCDQSPTTPGITPLLTMVHDFLIIHHHRARHLHCLAAC